eukprot:1138221-Pelagomonas_calceolata.AAC.3
MGLGGSDVKWEPQQIRGALRNTRVRSLVANYFSSGAVDDQGRVWTWGHGLHWQLGHGTMEHQMMPKQARCRKATAVVIWKGWGACGCH